MLSAAVETMLLRFRISPSSSTDKHGIRNSSQVLAFTFVALPYSSYKWLATLVVPRGTRRDASNRLRQHRGLLTNQVITST